LGNRYANNDDKKQNSGGNVKSYEVHIAVFDDFDNLAAKVKNTIVSNSPPAVASHETPPAALGTNAPTTSEPNIILAPSSKKFEITLS
jgi:hypothetical protein